ncbi:MAG: hypothetical protein GY714_09460 [Desulfobacterales bacterium]|nr:hypothetical protein [Desulfobacterales bacterium]MCP4161437.1 hypothetical protein [Deltaproteobacteria bacterium]
MHLLQTKFYIPDIDKNTVVLRKRVRDLIHGSPIVIISAPAGFGKTTILSEWAVNTNDKIAWVSLEKSENIPVTFWSYFITAVSSIIKECTKALEHIKFSNISEIENILIDLINDIESNGKKMSVVIDDYHVITDQSIHSGIEFLIDHLPSNMKIVIAGREDPNLSISRYRLSGKLAEIRASDLRFNYNESKDLLNKINGFNLNKSDIDSLNNRTEGWIAGLTLAVLSIKDQDDIKSFIDDFTGSHRYVLDYLIDEVLSGIPTRIKDFILKISITERFCKDLCEHLSEYSDSVRCLKYIEQNNIFLIPLDNHRKWFRFHHLFREFLIKNLMEEDNNLIKELHEKAFIWFNENGFDEDAFKHGINAEKYSDAAKLLAEKAPDLVSRSGGFILKGLIDQIPVDIVNTNADLCCYNVWFDILIGNFESVSLLYQDRFKDNKTVLGFIHIIDGYRYFYQTGEFEKCISEINKALLILPVAHITIREMGELIYSISLKYSGKIDLAYDYYRSVPETDDVGFFKAIYYADLLMSMGKYKHALSLIEESIEDGIKKFGNSLLPEYGYLYVQKGSILRERDEIDEALKAIRKGLFLGRNNEYLEFIFLGNLEYAWVLAASGNYDEAETVMARSIKAAEMSSTWGENMSLAYKARIEIIKGNLESAESILNGITGFNHEEVEISYHKYFEYLSYCRLCIAKNKTYRVHEITDPMIIEDHGTKGTLRLIECYILKAIAYYLDNKTEDSIKNIKKAFSLTENEKFVRIFIDEGENMIALLKEASKRKILPEYLKPYIIKRTEKESEGKKRSVIINEFKEDFNEREIEILKLMKGGASNKNIAEKLFLSVNTVRWYASRIFAKLDVKRRGEAVSYAEKYDLI